MLRFLLLVSLMLSAVFTLVGAVFSREWGWSEYASDELYVVYWQSVAFSLPPYFVINTDGQSEGQQLMWGDSPITRLSCSPDGRVLVFVTVEGHLYVMDDTGIVSDELINLDFEVLNVANNGRVMFMRENGYGQRLASEPLYTILDGYDFESGKPGGVSIVDPGMGLQVQAIDKVLLGFLSPDGTKRAASIPDGMGLEEQIYITNAFDGDYVQQLTHGQGKYYSAICFLTFRPETLIDQSS